MATTGRTTAGKSAAKKSAVGKTAVKETVVKMQEPLCFLNLSKNLGVGAGPQVVFCIGSARPRPPCKKTGSDGPCQTFVVKAHMTAPVSTVDSGAFGKDPIGSGATEPCDSKAAAVLDGKLDVRKLELRFKRADPLPTDETFSWRLRGIHAGRFTWTGKPGFRISGTMSGVNSIGSFRNPTIPAVSVDGTELHAGLGERCNEAILHGILTGTIKAPANHLLNGATVRAHYRITYDPGPDQLAACHGRLGTTGRGAIQGVIMPKC